jgi:hypothetical protein
LADSKIIEEAQFFEEPTFSTVNIMHCLEKIDWAEFWAMIFKNSYGHPAQHTYAYAVHSIFSEGIYLSEAFRYLGNYLPNVRELARLFLCG